MYLYRAKGTLIERTEYANSRDCDRGIIVIENFKFSPNDFQLIQLYYASPGALRFTSSELYTDGILSIENLYVEVHRKIYGKGNDGNEGCLRFNFVIMNRFWLYCDKIALRLCKSTSSYYSNFEFDNSLE